MKRRDEIAHYRRQVLFALGFIRRARPGSESIRTMAVQLAELRARVGSSMWKQVKAQLGSYAGDAQQLALYGAVVLDAKKKSSTEGDQQCQENSRRKRRDSHSDAPPAKPEIVTRPERTKDHVV